MTTTAKTRTKIVEPYLFFDGRCEEAAEFYKEALDAEIVMLLRFKDSPEQPDAGTEGGGGCAGGAMPSPEKIMHMSMRIGETMIMCSDGQCQGTPSFAGFSLALNVPSPEEAQRLFGRLAEGGQVVQPLTKTFFSPSFGIVADRFGVSWMIHVEA